MAQSGYTPISLYYTTTAAAAPTAGSLVNGELAINITDGKLYYKDNAGAVQLIGTKGGIGSSTNTQVLYNSSGLVVGSANLTFNGTTLTAGGLTTTGATSTGTLSATGVATFSAGTVSLPAITTTGDTNTGIFFPAADTIAFTEGGVESMRIDANGNLGLGITPQTWYLNSSVYGAFQFGAGALLYGRTTSSAVNLELSTNSYLDASAAYRYLFTGEASRYNQTSGAHIWYSAASGTAGNSFSYTESMRITSAGLVCVNGTSGTALLTIASSNTYPALKVPNIVEATNIVAGAPASTQTFYLGSGAVQYYTSNAANNWTVNFAMSAGTALNTAMAVGDSMSCTMLATQGATAYYNTTVQIDGTTSGVTTEWQGGTAPTSGNASSLDSYTYVIIKTASATYTVLASQTKFA